MKQELLREMTFWGIWLVIPLIVDIIIGIVSTVFVIMSYYKRRKTSLNFYPHVTILIPLYNSYKTLENCLKSIAEQDYPLKNISVLLVNNGKKDSSYEIFSKFQEENPELRVWWLDSSKGKSKALNKGLYMADGKYIINIDSDGILDGSAVRHAVEKFETNQDILAMTGVVLTNKNLIEKTRNVFLRLIQRCELFEYSEAFLVGRGYQSDTNTIFTLAGAFSCYRKDAILRTQLYNGETLGEDTHMTSQIREFLNGRIALCENAFFYVNPIEDLDRLYIQRQRWQRGQIEVSALFDELINREKKSFGNVLKYTLVKDHTLVFPRFIWIFAMIYLIFFDYPMRLIITANIIMYLLYVFNSAVYFYACGLYLREQNEYSSYMKKHGYIILILPLYRFIVFFMRVAGIINSVERYTSWNAKTFKDEKRIIREKINKRLILYYRIKEWVNNG